MRLSPFSTLRRRYTEKRARTSGLTLTGFPVRLSMGHHKVRASARTLRSLSRSSSVKRSNRIRLAAPTHPHQFRLVRGGRGRRPMRHRGLLHPAKVGDVIDVAELVDIRRLHLDGQFKSLRGLAHHRTITHISDITLHLFDAGNLLSL